jgi:hypothetical protein
VISDQCRCGRVQAAAPPFAGRCATVRSAGGAFAGGEAAVEAETTVDGVIVNRKGWIRSGPALKCFALYHGPADPGPASRAERPLRSEVHSEGLQPWPRSSNSLLTNTTSTSRTRQPSRRPCPTHHRPFLQFTPLAAARPLRRRRSRRQDNNAPPILAMLDWFYPRSAWIGRCGSVAQARLLGSVDRLPPAGADKR